MRVKLVTLQNERRTREILLRLPEVLIGRGKGCRIRIAAHEVSRKHCSIRFGKDEVFVRDLGSANGTYVNGISSAQEQRLKSGDRIQVGPVTFLVEYQTGRGPLKDVAFEEIDVIEAEEIVVLDADAIIEPVPVPNKPGAGKKPAATNRPPPSTVQSPLPVAELDLPTKPPAPLDPFDFGSTALPVAEVDESAVNKTPKRKKA